MAEGPQTAQRWSPTSPEGCSKSLVCPWGWMAQGPWALRGAYDL